MARGNMLLGQARGKVGSVVFSRLNGKQVTRSLAEKVSNPRTVGQQQQRALFATVVNAGKAFDTIVNHSFEGVKIGSKSRNYFTKKNLGILRNIYMQGAAGYGVEILPKGSDTVMANAYLMSSGSLGTCDVQKREVSSSTAGTSPTWQPVIMGAVTPYYDGLQLLKPSEFLGMAPYLAAGCEMAAVAVIYDDTDGEYHPVVLGRVVLSSDLTPFEEEGMFGVSGFVDGSYDPTKSVSPQLFKLGREDSNMCIRLDLSVIYGGTIDYALTTGNVAGVAVIVSQYDANAAKWKYTTSHMAPMYGSDHVHDAEAAIATYGDTAASTERASDEYLQQSTDTSNQTVATPIDSVYRFGLSRSGMTTSSDGGNEYLDIDIEIANETTSDVMCQFTINKEGNSIKASDVLYNLYSLGIFVKRWNVTSDGNSIKGTFAVEAQYITTEQKTIQIVANDEVMMGFNFSRLS